MISRAALAREALGVVVGLLVVVPLWFWFTAPRKPAVTVLPPHGQETLYDRVERQCLDEFGGAENQAVLNCQTKALRQYIDQWHRE
jgi:hypothetical protein